jgi:hypothetical protein
MKTKQKDITWQDMTLAPKEERQTQLQPLTIHSNTAITAKVVDDAYFYLTRIFGATMEYLEVKERYGRLALCEFIPDAVQVRVSDPVAVIPLFYTGKQFNSALRTLARIQQAWVNAGGLPYQTAATDMHKALDGMKSIIDELTPGEQKFFIRHMSRIVSQPHEYLPQASDWPSWKYATLFVTLAAFVYVLLVAFVGL